MRALIISLAFFISACGFTPLYGNLSDSPSVNEELSSIYVSPIEGREGQVLTNHLTEKFYSQNPVDNNKYTLTVTLDQTIDRYGFNQDGSTTREGFTLKSSFSLLNTASGEEITNGATTSRTSYDVVQSDFSNASARQDALERMLSETAQNITILLSTHFRQSEQ